MNYWCPNCIVEVETEPDQEVGLCPACEGAELVPWPSSGTKTTVVYEVVTAQDFHPTPESFSRGIRCTCTKCPCQCACSCKRHPCCGGT